MLRVLAESAYPISTPGPRVRIASFAPFLQAQGVALEYTPNLTDQEYSLIASPASALRKSAVLTRAAARAVFRRDDEHDLRLVHRLRMLNPVPGFDPPRRLDVYDFDDALFVGSTHGVNGRFGWAKQEASRWTECLRRSSLTIAGNSYLATKAQKFARRVEVVPSCIDPERQPPREHAEAESAVIGWIGSQTTSPYLAEILPAIERLNRQGVRARLVLIGANRSIAAPWIEHRPWSADTESANLASFDVGIMPMPDTEWARGKCGYKALQYFSAGVPAVASPVGVARELLAEGRGILASSTREWEAALNTLIGDLEERRERGVAARAFAKRHYSYQRWAPELAEMLRSVVAPG